MIVKHTACLKCLVLFYYKRKKGFFSFGIGCLLSYDIKLLVYIQDWGVGIGDGLPGCI